MRMNRPLMLMSMLTLSALLALTGCKKVSGGADQATSGVSQGAELYTDADDKFQIAGSPMRGNPDALVTIVGFSEFECPFCARVNPTIDEILAKYGDDVRIIFKNYPLDFHANAEPAARAALAAGEQGKFWEFHDIAFDNQRALNEENYQKWAEQLGLDMEAFNAAYNSDKLKEAVAADLRLATELGVRGTPNFYINGQNVRGAQPFANFQPVIDTELAEMRKLVEAGKSKSEALAERIAANVAAPEPAPSRPQARPTPDPADVLFVPVGDSPVLGNDNALVTLVVFSEFQCPFCNRIRPTIDQLVAKYGDDLRVVYKHNPLDFHPRAEPAARASIAAQNQGKFWEYHDLLFDNMSDLSDEAFVRHAEALGLNMETFAADMAAEATAARVAADVTLGRRVAAQGTPHSFVNGMRVRGAQPFEAFDSIVSKELEKAKEALSPAQQASGAYDALQAEANKGQAKMITPPAAPAAAPQAAPAKVDIPVGPNVPSRGPEDAKVTLVEYTNFQCGFCARFSANLKEALQDEKLEGNVRVVVKQFPLAMHRNAAPAAQASLAAHAQGKFWEYYDLLWTSTNSLDRASLERYASEVGLDMDKFKSDLDNGTYAEQVQAEFREGEGFGIRGTPTWFVNGVTYSGALPPAQIRQILLDALAAAE